MFPKHLTCFRNMWFWHTGRSIGAATDCTLSLTTAWVRIPAWACEKVASDLGLGGVYRRVLRFPPLHTTGYSHELATIGINVTKNKNSNSNVYPPDCNFTASSLPAGLCSYEIPAWYDLNLAPINAP